MRHLMLVVGLTGISCGCNDSIGNPEQITKMRPLGVSLSPVIAAPATVVKLTMHFAATKTDVITVTPATDFLEKYGVAVTATTVTVVDESTITDSVCNGQAVRCSFASFDYVAVRVELGVPSNDVLTLQRDQGRLLRYGLNVSAGGHTEPIVGDIMVFGPGSQALSVSDVPSVAITAPTGMGVLPADSKVGISGDITKYFGDELATVSWYVGGGTIKNRRARATQWDTPGSGTYTLVFTARGHDSKFMALAIRDFVVE